MAPSPTLDKKHYEILWANSAVLSSDRSKWKDFHSTNRIYLGNGKRLVVWRWTVKGPEILDVLRVTGMLADINSGVQIGMQGRRGQFAVGHTPSLLPQAYVFLWVPFFFDLRWVPNSFDDLHGQKNMTFPVCVKTLSNPSNQLSEGADYVTEYSEFQRNWPSHKIL